MGDKQDEDYSSLPVIEKIVHKVWKVRSEGYQELAKTFSKSSSDYDPCFQPYLDNPDLFRKVVTDSNVVAHEQGLTALNAMLEFGGTNACLRLRSMVLGPMIEKSIGQTRAGTKQKTLDALCWFVELDTPDPVIDELLPFLSHRTPKIVAATAHALVEILKLFGAKTVSPKPLIPVLPKLFGHADKTVRSEASNLTIELYKWMGDSLESIIFPDLKPVQQKDLKASFEKIKDVQPHQERYLKSQKESMERQQANGVSADGMDGDANDEEVDEGINTYDMVEAVDVLSKIPDDFYSRLGSPKWKERKAALEEVHSIFNVMKVSEGDFHEIIRTLAKCMKDANLQVVTLAADCITYLANGMRSAFSKYQQIVTGPILERTKEKKQSVADALNAALDAIFKGSSLSDILEVTVENMNHKTPNIRIESINFLTRCLKETKIPPKTPEVELIMTAAIKLIADNQALVRNAIAEAVGTLMKITGERSLNQQMEKIEENRRGKIMEYFESATVKAKTQKPPAPKKRKISGGIKRPAPNSNSTVPKKTAKTSTRPTSRPSTRTPTSNVSNEPTPKPAPSTRMTQANTRKRLPTTESRRPGAAMPRRSPIPREEFLSPPPRNNNSNTTKPVAINRGLASMSLSSTAMPLASSKLDISLSAAEKAELEELRSEKLVWEKEREKHTWQEQQFIADKTRFMHEITSIHVQNAKLIDDHAREILSYKAKETRLMRVESELDIEKSKVEKLEHEIEKMRLNLQKQASDMEKERSIESSVQSINSISSSSEFGKPSPLKESVKSTRSNFIPSSGIRYNPQQNTNSRQRPSAFERPITRGPPRFSQDQKENRIASSQSFVKSDDLEDHLKSPTRYRPNGRQSLAKRPLREEDGHKTIIPPGKTENWKRTSEVTSQLRARIENMKKRSLQPQTSLYNR